jgi:hypothetical protein
VLRPHLVTAAVAGDYRAYAPCAVRTRGEERTRRVEGGEGRASPGPELEEGAPDAPDPGSACEQIRRERELTADGELICLGADVVVQAKGLVDHHYTGPRAGRDNGGRYREITGGLWVNTG